MPRDPKSIRIVFLGTPGFAVSALRKLVEAKYNIVAVVTAPDKPAGRGRQVQQSEVKIYADSQGIKVLQPEKLKSPEFIEELKSLQPELQIVVAFRMLPEVVWSLPHLGTFNLHASLLPAYRGAAPINCAIMHGETRTGVTTFFLKHKIDTGNIIFREPVDIGPDETAGELHDRLMETGADLVLKTVDAIAAGNIKPVPQEELVKPGLELPEAPKIFREDCRINWKQPGKKIHDFVRGLSPYPGAWTQLQTSGEQKPTELKILRTRFLPGKYDASPVDTINFSTDGIKFNDGILIIVEVQAPGKRRMSAEEFLRGSSDFQNAIVIDR